MRVFVTAFLATLAGGVIARATERRPFSKAEPVEVAYQVDASCFARELEHGTFVQVDPFICEQLGAEEQRRADLRRLRFPRQAATPEGW